MIRSAIYVERIREFPTPPSVACCFSSCSFHAQMMRTFSFNEGFQVNFLEIKKEV